ncbi:GDSL-type esterase/lipase family protein [Porcipelethomonas sp.]|uniref:GDSL-type esterase/lipase family protein n=1 Tax=Porcipelethomonas sp. TaxID=2981675 RepID=UPI003EF4CA6A
MSGKRRRSYMYVKSTNGPLIRFRFKVIFIIFILVTAVCFLIYMTGVNIGGNDSGEGNVLWESQVSEADSSEAEQTEKTDEIINPVPASDPLTETYFGKCAFVGDSITVGLSDYQLVPIKNVYAEVGMNIEKINSDTIQTAYGEITVLDALTQAKPENIYIMLGSNGISWLSLNDMISYYSDFVDGVQKALPDSKIYILSIPPVTAGRETAEDEPILNSDIDKYNSELLKMADSKKLYYVDINTALKGNDGKLPEENAADDGMHFEKSTYKIMLNYILSHVAK